ncbi:MAG TPA: endolytic transglycosylase MltG [Candidatus Saccharimonadales bacterium]|nr:endolytic transglycosylase MltG [Candidatus Saccharimonadales bacterium]
MNDIRRSPKQIKKADILPAPRSYEAPESQRSSSSKKQAESILGNLDLPRVEPVKPTEKRKLINWIAGTILLGILLSMVAAAFGYFWYQEALKPKTQDYVQVEVEIPQGASIDQSSAILQNSGVVKSSLATQLYMTFTGKTSVKAGHYLLSPNQSVAEVVDWLNEGRVDTIEITILPGKTLADIKALFLTYGYSQQDIDAAFAKNYQFDLFEGKPADANLEGYIYPDTYFALSGDSVEDVLSSAFAEFDALIKQNNLKEQLARQGLNLYQGITLGSIVYKEVNGPEDQRKVAQVFLKRMSEGMPLGSDVTFIYGAKLLGVAPTPTLNSLYNTRIVLGLPPGPISNFTIGALEAVANPANTEYLYFVAGDDGITRFSYTNEEHEQNVNLYCRVLCELE